MVPVYYNLEACTAKYQVEATQQGQEFREYISPQEGFTLLDASVTILMNGEPIYGAYSYDEFADEIQIYIDSVTGPVSIDVTAQPTSSTIFTVWYTLTNCHALNEILEVAEGTNYYNEFIPDHTMDGATVSISMDGQDITSSVYTWESGSDHGIVNIPQVTGNIEIYINAPGIPEPEVIETTLEGVLNTQYEDYSRAYQFTAEVKDFYKGATTNNSDGKLTLTDGINDLWVLGSTATSNALYYDGSRYDFNNPQDFQQITLTNNIQIGDSITVKVYAYHKDPSTTRVKGIILSVIPQEPAVIQTTLDGV